MSFLTDLAKGFVRSAVNQVGRDGGKVISNKLYGNNHSTPIRSANNSNLLYEERNNENIQLTKQNISPSIMKYLFISFLSFAFFPLGTAILLINGLIKINQKDIKAYYYKKIAVYAKDRRYKRGVRFEGYQEQKVTTQIKASEEEIKELKKVGIVYIAISISIFLVFTLIIITSK